MWSSSTPPPEVILAVVAMTSSMFRVAVDLVATIYADNRESFNRLNNIRRGGGVSVGVRNGHGGGGVGLGVRNGHGGGRAEKEGSGNNSGKDTNGAVPSLYGTFRERTKQQSRQVEDRSQNRHGCGDSGYADVPQTDRKGKLRDKDDDKDPHERMEAGRGSGELHEGVISIDGGGGRIGARMNPKAFLLFGLHCILTVLFLTLTIASLRSSDETSTSINNMTSVFICSFLSLFLTAAMDVKDWNRKRFGVVQKTFAIGAALLLLLASFGLFVFHRGGDVMGVVFADEEGRAVMKYGTLGSLFVHAFATLWEASEFGLRSSLITSIDTVVDSSTESGSGRPSGIGGGRGLSRRAIFVMLKPYFWPDATESSAAANRIRAISTWACVASAKVCSLTAPIFIGRASTSLAHYQFAECIRYSIIYALITFLGNVFKEAQSLVYLKVAQAAFVQLSEVSFHHLHSLSLDWHLRKKLGEVIRSMDRGISACDTLMKYLFLRLVPAMVECLFVVVIFSAYFNHFVLSINVFFFVFVYVVLTIVMTLWRKKFRRAVSKSDNDWHDRCTDSLVNFETVKYFTAEKYEMERFGDAVKKYQSGSVAVAASLSLLNILQNLLLQACLASALALAALGIKQRMECCASHGCGSVPASDLDSEAVRMLSTLLGPNGAVMTQCCSTLPPGTCPGMEVGDFVTVLTYTLQLFTPLSFLGSIYNAIVMAMVDLSNLSELLAESPDVTDAPNAIPLPAVPPSSLISREKQSYVDDVAVEFDDVYFKYPTQADGVGLRGLSFTMQRGTVTAVVGHTGAGKTTISRLLFRFYDVNSGAVRVNGRDVRSLTQKSLRDAIGVVPQATALFNDTLHSNVLYGRRDATQDDLDSVARAAQLDKFIKSLPEGWNTVVGDRGLKLSGGEKQRTAIARCLLKDPPFLILDEATSSLDTVTEKSVQEALERLRHDRTCLVIAHRLGTIRNADKIVVLGEGKVVEEGTHDELLKLGGKYAEMWNMQLHYRERSDNFGSGDGEKDAAND